MLLFRPSRVKSGWPASEGTGEELRPCVSCVVAPAPIPPSGMPDGIALAARRAMSVLRLIGAASGQQPRSGTGGVHLGPHAAPPHTAASGWGFSRMGGKNERVDIATRHPGDGGYTVFR